MATIHAGQRIGRIDIFIGGGFPVAAIAAFATRFLPDGFTLTTGFGSWRGKLEQQITVTAYLPWDTAARLIAADGHSGEKVLMPAIPNSIHGIASTIAENAALQFEQESVLWAVAAVERAELTTPQAGYRRNG